MKFPQPAVALWVATMIAHCLLFPIRLIALQLPELNWEPRSDWINIKKDVTPAAVGDGLMDDTGAIQAALNVVSERDGQPTTVYLPPGTYRIAKTLVLKQRDGVAIIGCGRSTRIVWAGPGGKGDDSRMFWSDGVPRTRYVGIIWDGQGLANIGFDHDSKGYFETEIDHQHEAFLNFTGSGIRIGHDQNSPGAQATAETTYMNCLFLNCESGITLMQFNDYNHTLTGCEFRDCGVGVNGTGGVNFYVRDSHFERSRVMDVRVRGEHGISVRRCSSIGSGKFLEAATIAPLTIQDCQVSGWTNAAGTITLDSGPAVLFDCVFSNLPTRHAPVVVSSGQHLILSHNQSEGTDSVVKPGNSQNLTEVPPGKLGGSLKSPAQTFFKETAPIPGKVFDAKRDFGAKGDGLVDDTGAIQAAVNAARAHGQGAMAYLPSGVYALSSTLKIEGQDFYLGGCGVHTQLRGKDLKGQPLVQIDDPHRITLENIAIYGNGGDHSIDILQTGTSDSRIHYERVWFSGMYTKKPLAGGLHVRNLPKGAVVTGLHVTGNQHYSDSSRATILMNTSYEGSIIVDGKEPVRDGMLGFMTRLGTIVLHGLYIRDSQSVVMSDYYMEQSDRLLSFQGNSGDPSGRVTLQMPKSEGHLKPIISMDNYHGRIALGSSMFYPGGPKTVEITQIGENPMQFIYMAGQAYGQKPVFTFASSGKLTLLENAGDGSGPNVIAEGGLRAVADSLDDLRRLGATDLELNWR